MNDLQIIEAQEEIRNPKPKLWDLFPIISKSFIESWRGKYNVAVYKDRIFIVRQWNKDGVIEVQFCSDVVGHYTLHDGAYYMTAFTGDRRNDIFIRTINEYLSKFLNGEKSE